MNILLVTPMVPDVDGAGAIPVLLAAQLAALRARHTVVLVTAIGDERGEQAAARRLRDDGVDVHLADRRQPAGWRRWRRRWELVSRYLGQSWPWRTTWFAVPAIQRELDRLAAQRRFDVVVVEDSAMAFFDYPEGVPRVLTEHEVLRPRPLRRPGRAPSRWPAWLFGEIEWRRLVRAQSAAWNRFDLVVAFTSRDAQAIAGAAADVAPRVRVSPFGITLPAMAGPEREDPDALLFVGNFFHFPNRDAARWLVNEIMPRVLERRPGAHLRIVGNAPGPEIVGLASNSVAVIADADSIERELERAAVVVAPVRAGGGMRMKVLHAMASGKPVVTTPRGAEGFADADAPPPLEVADGVGELAATIIELLEQPARRRALGAAARQFVQARHSPEAWGERLEVLYREAQRGTGELASAPAGDEASPP